MSKSHFIIPFFIPHIGCPFDCVFCNQKKITGQNDAISPDEIIPTIEKYISTFPDNPGRVEVAFFGGSFTGIPVDKQQEYLKQVNIALERRMIDGIRLSTRPDFIDVGILTMLKKYNVDTVELGVQSLDDEVLKKSCRGHSSEDVREAVNLIHHFGFNLGLQMMIGLPGDTHEKDIRTAVEICKLNPRFVRIYPTLVIKGTALERMYKKGLYTPLTVQEAVDICKELLEIFLKKDIVVIRIGLQPTDHITSGRDVIAGPFHPAFRQIAQSSLIKKVIMKILEQKEDIREGVITMEVHPSMTSTVVGVKKENINKLSEIYPEIKFIVSPVSDIGKNNIRFVYDGYCFEKDYVEVLKQC